MKKKIALLTAILMLASVLAGCADKTDSNGNLILNKANMDNYVTELGAYTNLSVEAKLEEVSDEMLEYYVPYFFQNAAYEGITDWAAKDGDTVVIDYVGTIDGIAFDGGTASDQPLVLGSNSYIEGFEEGLIGAKKGDVKDLNLNFPEVYEKNPSLAGKACVFNVTVKSVIPVFSDESVAALNSEAYSNMAEFNDMVKEVVVQYNLEDYNNSIVYGAMDQVMANTVFKEVPQSLIDQQKEAVNTQYSSYASQYGTDVTTYLTYMGTSVDELATNYAKQTLVYQAIANKENLNVTDAEVEAGLQAVVDENEAYATIDDVLKEISREDYRTYLMSQKVFEFILANTTVTEPVADVSGADVSSNAQ